MDPTCFQQFIELQPVFKRSVWFKLTQSFINNRVVVVHQPNIFASDCRIWTVVAAIFDKFLMALQEAKPTDIRVIELTEARPKIIDVMEPRFILAKQVAQVVCPLKSGPP